MKQQLPRKQNLTEMLNFIAQELSTDKTSVGDIIKALDTKGFGVLIIFLSLLLLLPTGAIPGLPSIFSVFFVLIAGQIIIGRRSIWIPKRLSTYEIQAKNIKSSIKKVRPFTRRIDRIFKSRGFFMREKFLTYVTAALCIIVALTIPILGIIPFLAMVPAFAILCLGLALTQKDGLMFFIGLSFSVLSVSILPLTYQTIEEIF